GPTDDRDHGRAVPATSRHSGATPRCPRLRMVDTASGFGRGSPGFAFGKSGSFPGGSARGLADGLKDGIGRGFGMSHGFGIFSVRALLLALVAATLAGGTPSQARADAGQLCRAASNMVLAPGDMIMGPFIAGKDEYYGLTEIDDPTA